MQSTRHLDMSSKLRQMKMIHQGELVYVNYTTNGHLVNVEEVSDEHIVITHLVDVAEIEEAVLDHVIQQAEQRAEDEGECMFEESRGN